MSHAPARHTLAAPHECLAATCHPVAREGEAAQPFGAATGHLAASSSFRGPHHALAHHVRCAPVVRCCS